MAGGGGFGGNARAFFFAAIFGVGFFTAAFFFARFAAIESEGSRVVFLDALLTGPTIFRGRYCLPPGHVCLRTLGQSGGKSSARVLGAMPRRTLPLPVLLLGALIAACAPRAERPVSPAKETPATCLSIAAWNDMHGQLGPDEVQVDATRVPAGGVIAVADQVAALRATTDVVVVLDAGDLFTGPLDTTVAEGAPIPVHGLTSTMPR